MASTATIKAALGHVSSQVDEAIDIADIALVLASFDHPSTDLKIYRDHVRELAEAVHVAMLESGFDVDNPGPEEMAEVLSNVIARDFNYVGDEENYNDLDNANMMRVIERRRGLPVSLGILYLAAARAQGWVAAGLNFPGHFLVRLESRDGRRAIIDPFYNGRVMESRALRELLKLVRGTAVELDSSHYRPVSNRDVLVRLQNNVKTRRMELNEIAGALEAVEAMQMLDPENASLWREAGVMHMRLGHLKHAVEAFEGFVSRTPEGADRRKIAQVIEELRERLH
ncbi:MAG: transglutaminase-like domain-containing protein [Proteobacteria bacterium]|nr:transglutaminase-like domain-containing protein [Pseudomonadota bacterium]